MTTTREIMQARRAMCDLAIVGDITWAEFRWQWQLYNAIIDQRQDAWMAAFCA